MNDGQNICDAVGPVPEKDNVPRSANPYRRRNALAGECYGISPNSSRIGHR